MEALWLQLLAWVQSLGAGADMSQWDVVSLLALAAALGWASGLRLYAVVFVMGAAAALGWWTLPEGLQVLQHPAVLIASGFMLCVEFFADKVPLLDSLWDGLHALVRIPGGALLAAGLFGADEASMAVVAGLLGGTLSAAALTTKMTLRAAVNTSPEPFSNWGLSFLEDGLSVAALWLAATHPLWFALALSLVLLGSAWLLWVLFRFLRAVVRRVFSLFSPSHKVV